MSEPATSPEVEYPESDGRPMGETGRHGRALMDLVLTLALWFQDDEDVYVGGNQFLYWVEGDPSQVVCPDVYVAPGRPRRPLRDTWKVWQEGGAVPSFILEITSRSTRATDLGAKRGLYEQLGVRELALFDPLGEYLVPRLRMWRLEQGRYVEVSRRPAGLWSDVLGLFLDIDDEGWLVRLRQADGQPVLRPEERAEVEAQRAEAEAQRAEAEAQRAEAEAQRAEAESERAQRAEQERDRLLAELEALKSRR